MCGIVGYIGPKQAQPILLESLKRLEYRGYDSAGVAIISNGSILKAKSNSKPNLQKPNNNKTKDNDLVLNILKDKCKITILKNNLL